MKRFINKTVIYAIPVVLFMIVMEIELRRVPNNYSYKEEYVENNGASIETIILGSSHSYVGIKPSVLEMNSFNMANLSQSIFFDCELMKKDIVYLPNLKNIVISISYFSLFQNRDTQQEDWRKFEYYHYMGCKPSTVTPDCPGYYSVLLSKSIYEGVRQVMKYMIKGEDRIRCTELGWGTEYSCVLAKDFLKTGREAYKRHENNSLDCSENLSYLRTIINIAKKRGIRVFFVIAPSFITYYSNLDIKKLNRIYSTCELLAEEYDNVNFLDYLKDSRFTLKYFSDADHLNEKGAVLFSKILREEIGRSR
jgi:hypothetical protein